jgi:membrane-bound serine protease (ClpP class)
MVLGMLDPTVTVTEVQLVGGGTRYVLGDELETLRQEGKIGKETSIGQPGDPVVLSGRELRLQYGFASHLAANRRELAEALRVPPDALREDLLAAGGWRALRIDLRGRVTARTADDVTHAIRTAEANGSANLICLWIDSSGGMPAPASRIFHLLGDLDTRELRTVAYVDGEARSVAGLIALACDEVYARDDARLGGPGNTFLGPGEIADLRAAAQQLAAAKNRDWSLMAAMIDPDLEVFRCRREGTGAVRFLSEEERNEQEVPEQWQREERIALRDGMSGAQGKEYGVVRDTAESFQAVLQRFNVDQDIALAQRNPVIAAIEQLAAQPWFGRTLLFIAFFALISEASAPGIGVAGFVSTLCFLLFFWAQFLNGTSGWLELLLFGGGLACIALELFVLPGFGVFGVGGVVMVLLSIVLASQTFILPRNSYQFDQIPGSLMSVVAAGGGVVASVWIMRRYLADSWLFRRLILTPPSQEEEDLDRREALVDWSFLEGKRGITTTQLTPSGKARFGDEVVNVISDGVLVPKGAPVYVAEVRGSHVLVEPLDES